MTYTFPIDGTVFPTTPAAGVTQYRYDAGSAVWVPIVPDQTVTPGTYGTSTSVPQFSVDVSGAIFAAKNIDIQSSSTTQPGLVQLVDNTTTNDNTKALTASAGYVLQQEISDKGDGTVIEVKTGGGLTGGPITVSGTVSLAPSGVTSGSYTNTNITVDTFGRITAASNGNPGGVTGVLAGTGLGGGGTSGVVTLFNTGVLSLTAGSGISLSDTAGDIIISSLTGSGTVKQVNTGTGLTGGPITTTGTIQLSASGVVAGNYVFANVTVDAQGRVTSASTNTAVTQVNSGTGLSGGPITTTGTINLANTPVTPGSYTNANITVDAQGRLTSASSGSSSGGVSQLVAGSNITLSPPSGTGVVTINSTGGGGGGGTVTQVNTGTGLTGGPINTVGTVSLVPATTSTLGGVIPDGTTIVVDGSGTITAVSSGGGSVTQVNTGAGLTGGPITSTGTLSIAAQGIVDSMVNNTAAIQSSKLSYQFPAGAISTPVQTVQNRLKGEILVTDFGATGDGTTDDTTAVQNAIDYVNTLGGGVVVFPSGVYACSTLTVYSFTTLLGAGGTIKTFGSPDRQIRLTANSSNISILNLKFDSPGLNQGTEPEAGVIKDNGGAITFRLQNCSFYNIPVTLGQRMTALQLDAVSSFVSYNYVDQCGGDCLNFNSPGYNQVIGNYINSGGDGGIAFNNNARGCIIGNFVKKCSLGVGSGPTGTTTAPFSEYTIANNVFDSCDYGINMGWFNYAGREGPTNVSITGNTITRCKSGGIYYGGNLSTVDKYISISNNVISNIGTDDWDGTPNPNADGISLNACPESSVVGNIVTNCTRTAIYSQSSPGINITSNTIKTALFGVVCAPASTRFIISLNQIKSTSAGVTPGAGSTNLININNLVTP